MVARLTLGVGLLVARAASPAPATPPPLTIPQLIIRAASREGLDPLFALRVAYRESKFHPEVVSEAGAIGVMQLMPLTIKVMGVQDPFDPQQNIGAGVAYLASLVERYGSESKADCVYGFGAKACR